MYVPLTTLTMPTFKVTVPTEAPEWSMLIVNELTKCLECICEQMNDLDSNLSGKCNALRAQRSEENRL